MSRRMLMCLPIVLVASLLSPSAIVAQWSVSVEPAESDLKSRIDSTDQSALFIVTNTGTEADDYTLECDTSGAVESCKLRLTVVALAPQEAANVEVVFGAGDRGDGTVRLEVEGVKGDAKDDAEYAVRVDTPGWVDVRPDGGVTPDRAADGRQHTDDFTVENLGSAAATFSLECDETGIVKCESLSVSSITLAPGDSAVVSVTYTVDEEGVGVLILGAASDRDDWKTAGYWVVRNCPNGCAARGGGGSR